MSDLPTLLRKARTATPETLLTEILPEAFPHLSTFTINELALALRIGLLSAAKPPAAPSDPLDNRHTV